MIEVSKRYFLLGSVGLLAAPAIVKAENLMRIVRPPPFIDLWPWYGPTIPVTWQRELLELGPLVPANWREGVRLVNLNLTHSKGI